jgi:DNA-binding response OmpR family regulator
MLNPVISRLKKKLPEELIQSVYGIGYKLVSLDNKEI